MTIREGWPSFEDWQRARQLKKALPAFTQVFDTMRSVFENLGVTIIEAAKGINDFFEALTQATVDEEQHINEYPPPHQEEADSPIRFPRRW
jgi:hypothetical protein